ncbi:MAG: D-aminoacylase [Dehalobacterium sp.]
MYDLILKNGTIIDGSGKEAFVGDIGIIDDKICAIGELPIHDANKVIDIAGKIVCPGFIDMHSHSDLILLEKNTSDVKVRQGVTTELLGQDGLGVAPVISDDGVDLVKNLVSSLAGEPSIEWKWTSFGSYLDALDRNGLPVNTAVLVTHGAVRIAVMGMEGRKATEEELILMEEIIKQSINEGAVGFSTGMVYPPCNYADKEELVRLTAAAKDTVFVIHMRDEGDEFIEALGETMDICKQSGIKLHISHLKTYGPKNWHKMKDALKIITKAQENHQRITADRYPYVAGCTFLAALLPTWTLAGGNKKLIERLKDYSQREIIKADYTKSGWTNRPLSVGWENIRIASMRTSNNKRFEGKSLSEIAISRGQDPADTLCDILIEEDGGGTMIIFYGNEDVLSSVLIHPLVTIGSDGIYGGKPHPRLYGSFPRMIGHYVREKGLMPMEEAIRKMTSLPAEILRLDRRGMIKCGYYADIVVFDFKEISDQATFDNPMQYPTGINHVLVNGNIVVENGSYNGSLSGRVLRSQ